MVGESGSGKTTVGTSLLSPSRAGALIDSEDPCTQDRDVLGPHLAWEVPDCAARGDRLRAAGLPPRSARGIRIGKADRRG